ncbi:MAG: glycine zipper 2TM domain-containing protein [Burkholderiales bacterium]
MTRWMGITAMLLAAGVSTGCATSNSGAAYSREQARQVQEVQLGIVESVRPVQIEGTKTAIGTAAGAALGGLLGSQIGHGKGSAAGAVIGAVGGGVAGAAAEEGITRRAGYEITVKLDNGRLIAVTQEADEAFRSGERVRIVSGGGVTRIAH